MPQVPMDTAQWAQVRELFDLLLALPADARGARLRQLSAPPQVLAELASLLAHAQDEGDAGAVPGRPGSGFLATPVAALAQALAEVDRAAGQDEAGHTGQRLGAWRLHELLGQGGMGEVWLARRDDGAWQGEAAVKLLRSGLDSGRVLARFAQEQQALARLNHPHIAHLLDAGRSDDGRPYFVLERVTGQPIDLACAELSLAQRLQLFLQLTDAVAHAHRQLLVHRDLKPSNVMVTAEGQVKLLDFGIAKALDPLEGSDGQATLAGERPFTPYFASPEQVRGEPVGTATDIYSLGVLLYLMLTGARPYARGVQTASQAAHSVLHDEPTRPSALPPNQTLDRHWLAHRKRLQGDLDNILLKALDKRIDQRYATVDALAADIRAHLAGYPVTAQHQGWPYLAWKFARRNKAVVAAGALAALALVAGLGATMWQKREADSAREVAERRFAQVRQLARAMVFRYHDQIAQLPGAISTREALLQDAVSYLDSLLAEGPTDPALARELAETYFRIAVLQGEQFSPSQERLVDAGRNLAKALALLPAYIDQPGIEVLALHQAADMWLAKASQSARQARMAQGRDALAQGRSLVARALQRQPGDLQAQSRLATLEGRLGLALGGSSGSANLGLLSQGEQHLRQSLLMFERLQQAEPDQVEWVHQLAWGCHNLGVALLLQGRADEALVLARRTLALRLDAARRSPGNTHFASQPGPAWAQLAHVLSVLGQTEASLQALAQAREVMQAAVSADPSNKAAQRDLGLLGFLSGRSLAMAGQMAAARQALLQFLAPAPAQDSDFYLSRIRAQAQIWLARSQLADQPEAALATARQAEAALQGDDDNASRRWGLAQAQGETAAALAGLGRSGEAAAVARSALATWRSARPEGELTPALFAAALQQVERLAAVQAVEVTPPPSSR